MSGINTSQGLEVDDQNELRARLNAILAELQVGHEALAEDEDVLEEDLLKEVA